MWRFSGQDVAAGAQNSLKPPASGRYGPLERWDRTMTDKGGLLLMIIGALGIVSSWWIPFWIGDPSWEGTRLTYGTDYKGDCTTTSVNLAGPFVA